MNEYRIDSKIRNNLLLSAIEGAGHRTGGIFAAQAGISYSLLVNLINMKKSPYLRNGELNQGVANLCVFINAMPSELFNDQQIQRPIIDNKTTVQLSSSEIAGYIESNNQPDIMLEKIEEKSLVKTAMSNALGMLTDRERDIVTRRSVDGETFDSIASSEGVTRERIRQIEQKALRKLRHESRGLHGFMQ